MSTKNLITCVIMTICRYPIAPQITTIVSTPQQNYFNPKAGTTNPRNNVTNGFPYLNVHYFFLPTMVDRYYRYNYIDMLRKIGMIFHKDILIYVTVVK